MKLLFVINLFALINSVFCSKDRGKYLEISNGKQTAYITVDECKNIGQSVADQYLDSDSYDNPDNCQDKGRVIINSSHCYLSSNGLTELADNIVYNNARYYDIDTTNRRVLTEWG
eukprot:jgi/Orpsp1_1/1174406/evm.model.c7180000049982.1